MKVVFLDVDGVLNCGESKSRCGCFIGIDDSRVKLLKEIIEKTDAKIVLVSTWKFGWEPIDKEAMDRGGIYLDKKMKRQGLTIIDKTYDRGWNRGQGINQYLEKHPEITSWIILDDETFEYEEEGVISHLVKTSFYNDGLQETHVKDAIARLNESDGTKIEKGA